MVVSTRDGRGCGVNAWYAARPAHGLHLAADRQQQLKLRPQAEAHHLSGSASALSCVTARQDVTPGQTDVRGGKRELKQTENQGEGRVPETLKTEKTRTLTY